MTFLELCKRVRQDAGVSGDGPTSVSSQTGILGKIVTFVKNANNEIQLENIDWRFLWAQGDGSTIANIGDYFAADFGISRMRSIGTFTCNGSVLEPRDWDWYMREVKAKGEADRQGEPLYYIPRPDGKIVLFPVPAEAYPVSVDYYRKPVQLDNGTDISVIPEEYHEAIVCRALMFYAHYEEDTYLFQTKLLEYNQWLNRLNQTQQPQITFG